MKCNMGKADRIIRGFVGIGVLAAGYYFQTWWGALGIIPLATTAFAWCPMYLPFGISTKKSD